MQICGKEVNIEDLKKNASELEKLMNDPEVLSAIESKVAEANEKLAAFKPEIKETPNLQEALAKLNDKLSSSEFAAELKKIKKDFGEAVEDLPEILNKANSKINEFINELPSTEDLNKALDGSVTGDALVKLNAKIAEAELKLAEKLARQGKPTVNANTICDQVPNIEVETKTIDIKEIKSKIINGTPVIDPVTEKPVQEEVTVQKQIKQKVELPKEPVIPKEPPVKSEPKPVQKQITRDPNSKASLIYKKYGNKGIHKYRREDAIKKSDDRQEQRQFLFAQVVWYYINVARAWGAPFTDLTDKEVYDQMIRLNFKPKRLQQSFEEASTRIPEGERKLAFNYARNLYDGDLISETVSFEKALREFHSTGFEAN